MTQLENHKPVIILGAGPGGVQLGYFLAERGIDYQILERGPGPGDFFRALPRSRRLISLNKIHVGTRHAEKRLRWDWNSLIGGSPDDPRFADFDQAYRPQADSLVNYLGDFCQRHELQVHVGAEIVSIDRADGRFQLKSAAGEAFSCDLLVVATGVSRPYTPPIPGIEHAEHYARFQADPARYRDKRVLVIGKGNAAFETADWLLPHARHVHLVSRSYYRTAASTHYLGDVHSVNTTFDDTFFFKQHNAILNARIVDITPKDGRYAVRLEYSEDDEADEMIYDSIIGCTGFGLETAIFEPATMPALCHDDKLPTLNSDWESVSVPGLYFAGTLMQANDYRKSSTPFIKGIRYNALALANILSERVSGTPWPTTAVARQGLFDAIFERIHTNASLWHSWGALCDAFIYDQERGTFAHYENLPQQRLAALGLLDRGFGVVLKFGHEYPAADERAPCGDFGFIHPSVQLFGHGRLLEERHLEEDVDADWTDKTRWGGPVAAITTRAEEMCRAGDAQASRAEPELAGSN